MKNTSLLLSLLTIILSFSANAFQDQKPKVYDGTNFNEVVCRFYALEDFSSIPSLNLTSYTEYRRNEKVKAYDMLAQIYRSSDSELKYTISSGFLNSESKSKELDRNNIPKIFSIFNRLQSGTILMTPVSTQEHDAFELSWDRKYDNTRYRELIRLKAVGPLCKEVLSHEYRELTLDLLTSSFYEEANPKAILGVKVVEK